MKGPKRYPPPESRAASKHVLVYPNWMSAQRYHEYQESRASAARTAHDKLNQEADRHNAFVENAKSMASHFLKRRSNCPIKFVIQWLFYSFLETAIIGG